MDINTKSSQNSKFRNFLGMSFFFKKEIEAPIVQNELKHKEEKTLKQELDDKVNDLISNKDELKIEIILDKGYELNYSQVYSILRAKMSSQKIKEHAFEAYDTNIKYDVVEKLNKLAQGIENETKFEGTQFKSYITQASSLAQTTYTFWNYFDKEKLLSDKDYNLQFVDACESAKEKLSFYVNNYIPKNYFGNDILSLLIQNIDEYLNIIKDSPEDSLSKFDTLLKNKIPEATKEVIKNINQLYAEVSNQTLSVEQNLEIHNFYKKRLPQVLEEYSNISPLYRATLVKNNTDPDQLLLDSVIEIKDKIQELCDKVQYDNAHQLKVSHRYLKNI